MLSIIGSVLERVTIVLSALAFAQIPLFIQQYEQQLIGRIDELQTQVNAFQKAAGGLSLDAYIAKFSSNSDLIIANHGKILHTIVDRYSSLTQTYASLESANGIVKPFVFIAHFYPDIAQSTWGHFNLGLPLTVEGAFYSLAGVMVGMLFIRMISFPFRRLSVREKSAE